VAAEIAESQDVDHRDSDVALDLLPSTSPAPPAYVSSFPPGLVVWHWCPPIESVDLLFECLSLMPSFSNASESALPV